MSVRRLLIAAALSIPSLCACTEADGATADPGDRGGSFGEPFESMDAGVEPSADAERDSEAGDDEDVQLRVLQGILNLRASYVCHAPDFDLDDPDAGFASAVELPLTLADGGALEFGTWTTYANVRGIGGALTVHRAPSADGGYADAAAADAGPTDGGGADPNAPSRCDRASLEAVLPLPMPAAWAAPAREEMDAGMPADGGAWAEAGPASVETRGFVSRVSGGEPLTLFGSGFLIDRGELERRVEAERERYESEHAGDAEGALAAAERYRHAIEATYGPRFLLSRAQPARRAVSFSLQFAHLVPDVPGPADSSSGALRLCITVGAMERSELGDAGAAVFAFRNNALLGDDLNPAPAYRFRVFVQSAYAQEQKTCATTSLKPVAELMVEPETFEAGHSYTLVALGATKPDEICTSMAGSLIRPGCAPGIEDPRPRLVLIEN